MTSSTAAGSDKMIGGAGNDLYIVDATSDTVIENEAADGIDVVQASATFSLNKSSSTQVESLMLTGTADIDGTGNAIDNVLLGNSGRNTLSGLGGDDMIEGGEGDDRLIGGANTGCRRHAFVRACGRTDHRDAREHGCAEHRRRTRHDPSVEPDRFGAGRRPDRQRHCEPAARTRRRGHPQCRQRQRHAGRWRGPRHTYRRRRHRQLRLRPGRRGQRRSGQGLRTR